MSDLVKEVGDTITNQKLATNSGKSVYLTEYTWNHTTLHARTADPSVTYLQSIFPHDKNLQLVEEMYHYFGDDLLNPGKMRVKL